MEESYILISTLNDFIFCPYSIYLHNVYESTDESLFHATPQAQGCITHETVDENVKTLIRHYAAKNRTVCQGLHCRR